nr:hypothetical protein [uncultured Pedobacter sp.]
MEKKIVSTFMFSEPHEQDLLWLKFNVEDAFVNEWIITESTYTFQGKSKSLYLEDILSQPRFKRFKEKVHYIVVEKNYNFEFEPKLKDIIKRRIKRSLISALKKQYELVSYAELASFNAEINQRGACVNYIKSKYSAEDIVLTCDTDEIFDLNKDKKTEFLKIISDNSTPFYLKREIFCYDFDNYTNRLRFSPIIKVKDVSTIEDLHEIRHPKPSNRNIITTEKPLIFEFTFCFSKDAIVKKLSTFAHVTDLNEKSLDFCFDNNISLISPGQINENYRNAKDNFYFKIQPSKFAFPMFLMENFEFFRTGIVNPNYLEVRADNKQLYVNN